ncbi:MAG TPA: ABC transporter permease [Blastocatellia bacterium]|jgi:putative ABC transport system permease protein|nr:ABC transporter permease [Blastocatellia bacterium]
MAIPLKYNLRNLLVRRTSTLFTAGSIALTVAVFITLTALATGLRTAFISTGGERNLIVLRQNSDTETNSSVTPAEFQNIKYLDGVARDGAGMPRASAETIVLINLPRLDNPQGSNVIIRGLAPAGFALRPQVQVAAGRWFRPGSREVVVSEKVARRFVSTGLGDRLRFGKSEWAVVGAFDAGGTAFDSEIWCDVNQLMNDYNRTSYSSVLAETTGAQALAALADRIKDDRRLKLDAFSETAYYAKQTSSATPVQALGIFIAVLMAIGAAFAAMNAMYTAVANRTREIGTLRVLGFSRASIWLSFAIESTVLSLLGGILGCLVTLPINGISTGTTNFSTFSEIAFQFRVTGELLTTGLVFSALIGFFGGSLPALKAAREQIVTALKTRG